MDEVEVLCEKLAQSENLAQTLKTEVSKLSTQNITNLGRILKNEWIRIELRKMISSNLNKDCLYPFFEAFILSQDQNVFGETAENFDYRKEELTSEAILAFQHFHDKDWEIGHENYKTLMESGETLLSEESYDEAYLCFTKAVFLTSVLESCDDFFIPELDIKDYRDFGLKIWNFEARKKQIEALFKSKKSRKTSIYANYLLSSISNTKVSNTQGFYCALKPSSYVTLMEQFLDSELQINTPFSGIEHLRLPIEMLCQMEKSTELSKSLQNLRKLGFDAMMNYMEEDKEQDAEILKSRARIIVDPTSSQKFFNGQFYVSTIEIAIKVAKDGDIIFLEPGIYTGETQHVDKKIFEIRKSVTFLGAGYQSVIQGSLVKWGSGKLRFENLRLLIGEEKDDNEEIYLMDGTTEFIRCSVSSSANTAIYIVGKNNPTLAEFDLCVLDGFDSCLRFFSLEGPLANVSMTHCFAHSMYSVVSVVNVEETVNLSVKIEHCSIMDVQDFVKLLIPESSTTICKITFSEIELCLYDSESSSTVAAITSGTLFAQNCHIYGNHIDIIGFDLQRMFAELQSITIETIGENRRQFSIGQGIKLVDVRQSTLQNIKVTGLRVGFQVSNGTEHLKSSSCDIQSCSTEDCSVGILIKQIDDFQYSNEIELALNIDHCRFSKTYYGIMVENVKAHINISHAIFELTPKPILLHNSSLKSLKVEDSSPKLVELEKEVLSSAAYTDHLEDLYVQLAIEENLPHRIEYNADEYVVLTDFHVPT